MKWVFLFAISFQPCPEYACQSTSLPGDGEYYDTRAACETAAISFARSRHLNNPILHLETICVQREPPR